MRWALTTAFIAAILAAAPAAMAADGRAPGAPGKRTVWAPANKQGYGTAHERASRPAFTLQGGTLSEVYYPNLGTPSVRRLELVVARGGRAERESTATRSRVTMADPRALVYRQVNTDRNGQYRIEKTFITDPRRQTVLVRIRFRTLKGAAHRVYAVYDPALDNTGGDDHGRTAGRSLLARDGRVASAVVARPGFTRTSNGFLGRSDGWRDLHRNGRLDRTYRSAGKGNVVQTAQTRLTGRGRRQSLTLAIGLGRTERRALRAARGSLGEGFTRVRDRYAAGWHRYLGSLPPAPASVAAHRGLYDASLMVMAALEDKTYRGASVASPSMPWAWGDGTVEKPSGPYHLVWSRDLYQVATAQLAAGDRPAAGRLLSYLFRRQQKKDGSFPQNSDVDGREHWKMLQMDEVAFPLVLAWQLGRTDAGTWRRHVKPAADFIVRKGPETEQERWENQSGYSPGTIAAQIAGLTCAADIARRNGDAAAAARYQRVADSWAANVERWTATRTGPFSKRPYYLRVSKKRDPDKGTTYPIGDTGPKKADQRKVVDPSFLELVRLGIKPPSDPTILNSIGVVDSVLGVRTPFGQFWHRFTYDGYGEDRTGAMWKLQDQAKRRTLGRAWPLFAGERGEYELLAGGDARARLAAMAGAASSGQMLPEQVWDGRAPSGRGGARTGKGTLSATPLAWTHAQFVRLAWSIDAGRPVERPSIVACRYAGC